MTEEEDLARAAELFAYLEGIPAGADRTPEMEAAEDELDGITWRVVFCPDSPWPESKAQLMKLKLMQELMEQLKSM